ncbi:3'-5' exonuclease [Segeticoccus rhizosphaerae]|uniref:3'-5' exonuclease n=1 Tax=Segeticoccus rhizosphaerae TaxID=1104777 RepID=UPI0010C0BB63|nr:3'-5' exonuclease [Ornithinicoccus soli]
MTIASGPTPGLGKIVPKGRQPDAIYFPPDRDMVALGTAGTGKTTMAVLRARFLADSDCSNHGPVLLVTYNNALVRYLRHLVPGANTNIRVETYGKFARGYLNSIGKMPPWNGILQTDQLRRKVASAVSKVRTTYKPSPFFDLDTRFFVDELAWIANMGIADLQQYLDIERIGRKRGLNEARRKAVWKVRTEYLRARETEGIPYDWNDIATGVLNGLKSDTRPRKYRHVIIDEGQDLSPEAIRSLKAAVQPGGTVSFFGDYHQQIYGQGLSFRSCGLEITAVAPFQDNYRNTAQIARVAIAMSDMLHLGTDPEDLVEPKEPSAGGTMPALVKCKDYTAEVAEIQRIAIDQGDASVVGILTRTWPDAHAAVRGMKKVRKLRDDGNSTWDPTPGIYYGTYHSAKGLEFDVVLMPFCTVVDMPNKEVVDAYGKDDASTRDGKLLYVAVTRAKAELTVTYSGTITPLLPMDDGLWQHEEL